MKSFSKSALQEAKSAMERYPRKEAALLPILHIAQQEFGFIDEEAELAVAELMGISPVSVREVSQFYFMVHHHPIGKYHLQVCQNISCTLMGAETILNHIKKRLGIEADQVTDDGKFSLERVECIACCDRAPAMLVNDELHTELTPDKIDELIKKLDPKKTFGDSPQAQDQQD